VDFCGVGRFGLGWMVGWLGTTPRMKKEKGRKGVVERCLHKRQCVGWKWVEDVGEEER
jgi:hypothetical protein